MGATDGAARQQPEVHPLGPRRGGPAGARPIPRSGAAPATASRRSDPMQVRAAVVRNCLDCHGIRGRTPGGAGQRVRHLPRAAGAGRPPLPYRRESIPCPTLALGLQASGRKATASRRAWAVAASRPRAPPATRATSAPSATSMLRRCPPSRRCSPTPDPWRTGRSFARRRVTRILRSCSATGSRRGGKLRRCATCHTQESCLGCHQASPTVALAMHRAGPGRGPGARVERKRPDSHGIDFSDNHAELASARPQSCGACHARSQCLDCHRPNAADPSPGYHPAGFLTTHPAAAYTRDQSCADCHNQSQFCADCHVSAGLGSTDGLRGAGYHDAKAEFLLNHGQAARQNLESCVSCHSERDCLTCHSAQGGRRFNPHGPGFDPETLRRKNPSMCTACHGTAIPGD